MISPSFFPGWRPLLLQMVFRVFLPVALLLLAAFTYVWRINDKPFDFDERLTLNMTTSLCGNANKERVTGTYLVNPLPKSVFTSADYWERFSLGNTFSTVMSDNGQGLPFMLLLRGVFVTNGVSVFNGRLLSAALLLLAAALLGRLLMGVENPPGKTVVVVTALTLLLFNGLLIDLSQYIRVYTLGVLGVVISWALLYQLHRKASWGTALWLGIVWALLFLTHYFTAPLIAGQLVYLLAFERKLLSKKVLGALATGSLGILLFWLFPLGGFEVIAAIFKFHGQHTNNLQVWIPLTTAGQAISGFAANFATLFGAATTTGMGLKTVANILMALPGWILCIGLLRQNNLNPSQKFLVKVALTGLAMHLLFVLGHVLITGRTLLFTARYWCFCIPFSVVLLGIAFEKARHSGGLWRSVALLSTGCLLFRMSLSLYTAWSGKRIVSLTKTECISATKGLDMEGLSTTIQQRWKPGDTVIFSTWKNAQATNWFLREAPQIVQTVDTTQRREVTFKTLEGSFPIEIGRGTPAAARPCF